MIVITKRTQHSAAHPAQHVVTGWFRWRRTVTTATTTTWTNASTPAHGKTRGNMGSKGVNLQQIFNRIYYNINIKYKIEKINLIFKI